MNQSNPQSLERLSRFLCLILRHRPEVVGLTLTSEGFVPIKELFSAIREQSHYRWVTEDLLWSVIRNDIKGRYEVVGEQVRAAYGHSIPVEIDFSSIKLESLPTILYHGTSPEASWDIVMKGILPQQRQFVHLSESIEQARLIGSRHTHGGQPVIFAVDVYKAAATGIRFKQGGKGVYISDPIKPEFIEIVDAED